ncbi:HTH gntR-type domain-containing protein [Bordetella sputigena]|uniref:FadR/GntR family transcriptional regulator n=1 Tax=Bordetella sputigena TaxID=1416810 RepID=UPI0039F0CF53
MQHPYIPPGIDALDEQPIPRGAGLAAGVAQRLRLAIERRDIAADGNRLPSEAALARTYGVSRPVIREAMSLLKSDGLVISHQGRGQFINPQGSSVFRMEPPLDTEEGLSELFEFLLAVEVPATRLAAQRRSAAELEAIRSAYQRLYQATRDLGDGTDEDEAFHRAIVQASHNQYFIGFANFLDARVRGLIRTARKNTRNRSMELVWQVQREHEAILRAIEDGDPERASAAATAHLNNAASRLALYRE